MSKAKDIVDYMHDERAQGKSTYQDMVKYAILCQDKTIGLDIVKVR